jgi:hypothetical protein
LSSDFGQFVISAELCTGQLGELERQRIACSGRSEINAVVGVPAPAARAFVLHLERAKVHCASSDRVLFRAVLGRATTAAAESSW